MFKTILKGVKCTYGDVFDANELTAQKYTAWWYGSRWGGTISPGDLVPGVLYYRWYQIIVTTIINKPPYRKELYSYLG